MKIDPVTFEVDTSGGTHPIYVWEAPVRIWHWAMAVCMAVMIVTGFLIGTPLVANAGDTWVTYDFDLYDPFRIPDLLGYCWKSLRSDDFYSATLVSQMVEGCYRSSALLPFHQENGAGIRRP